MLTRVLLVFFLSIYATVARAEKIAYEIYAIDEAGKPSLMAKGVKDYGDADLEIEERNVRGEIHWSKSLELEGVFSIGASIYREPEVTGFGSGRGVLLAVSAGNGLAQLFPGTSRSCKKQGTCR